MTNDKKYKHGSAGTLLQAATLTVALLVSGPAVTAPWETGVALDVGITHTNNLFLAPPDQEESETVYFVSPTFTLTSDGERTEADIRYQPQGYFYSDFDDANEVYHIVDASLTTAVVADRLFLYLSGVHFQSIVDPDLAIPTSNLPVTGNRIDSTVLEARPYWEQRLGTADLRIEAGYRDLEYDDDRFQSAVEKNGSFSLDNFERQQGIAWGLDYAYRRLEYDLSPPFEFQTASANLGYWVSNALRLFGAGGAETAFDNLFEANLDEDFWEAGFQYTPNQRLNLELAAGERSYGTSLRGDFSYTLRRGSLSMTYAEGPASRALTQFDTRPLVTTDSLDGILDRPGNADRFVRKRGEVTMQVELNKTEISLRGFTEDRESRTTDDGAVLPDESLSGIAADFDWRFGAKTSLQLGASVASRDDGVNDDELTRFSLGVAYEIGPNTSIRIEGIRSEQNGDQPLDYTENQGRLVFRIELL